MFDDFTEYEVRTGRGTVFTRAGGSGRRHSCCTVTRRPTPWHSAAPLLTGRHTVVAADLSGDGASFRPVPAPDDAPHSKRSIAVDLVDTMAGLGPGRFAVAGHDRVGRVAYRMALDHLDRVTAAAAFGVVPTGEVWARVDSRWRCRASTATSSTCGGRGPVRSPVRVGGEPLPTIDHAAGHVWPAWSSRTRSCSFANPAVGTALMQADPRLGIDLPLRMPVWADSVFGRKHATSPA